MRDPVKVLCPLYKLPTILLPHLNVEWYFYQEHDFDPSACEGIDLLLMPARRICSGALEARMLEHVARGMHVLVYGGWNAFTQPFLEQSSLTTGVLHIKTTALRNTITDMTFVAGDHPLQQAFAKMDVVPLLGGHNEISFDDSLNGPSFTSVAEDKFTRDDLILVKAWHAASIVLVAFDLDGSWPRKILLGPACIDFFEALIAGTTGKVIAREPGGFHGPRTVFDPDVAGMVARLWTAPEREVLRVLVGMVRSKRGKESQNYKNNILWYLGDHFYEHQDVETAIMLAREQYKVHARINIKHALLTRAKIEKLELLKLISQEAVDVQQIKARLRLIRTIYARVGPFKSMALFFVFMLQLVEILEKYLKIVTFNRNHPDMNEQVVIDPRDIHELFERFRSIAKEGQSHGVFPFVQMYLCKHLFEPQHRWRCMPFFDMQETEMEALFERYDPLLYRGVLKKYDASLSILKHAIYNPAVVDPNELATFLDQVESTTRRMMYEMILAYFRTHNVGSMLEIVSCCIAGTAGVERLALKQFLKMAGSLRLRGMTPSYGKRLVLERAGAFKFLEIEGTTVWLSPEARKRFDKVLRASKIFACTRTQLFKRDIEALERAYHAA